jgi:hypothetical protein
MSSTTVLAGACRRQSRREEERGGKTRGGGGIPSRTRGEEAASRGTLGKRDGGTRTPGWRLGARATCDSACSRASAPKQFREGMFDSAKCESLN